MVTIALNAGIVTHVPIGGAIWRGTRTRHGLLRREVGVVLRGVVQTVDTNFAAGIFRTERKRGKIPRLVLDACACALRKCVCVHVRVCT